MHSSKRLLVVRLVRIDRPLFFPIFGVITVQGLMARPDSRFCLIGFQVVDPPACRLPTIGIYSSTVHVTL